MAKLESTKRKKSHRRKGDARKGKARMCDICGEEPVVGGVYLWYTLEDGGSGPPEYDQEPCRECLKAVTQEIIEAMRDAELERQLEALERSMRRSGCLDESETG
jgi:hypothetical protein